jgi:hypothetical protein
MSILIDPRVRHFGEGIKQCPVLKNKSWSAIMPKQNLNGVYTGFSFKFILKVGVEESIVNAPRITDHGSAV